MERTYVDVRQLCGDQPIDQLFALLSNSRRRHTLYQLYRSEDGAVGVEALTDAVAVSETGRADESRSKSVYVSLYQTHLPKLESFGVVEYDRDEQVVRLSDEAAAAVVEPGQSSDWAVRYAAVAAAGWLVTAGIAVLPSAGVGLVPAVSSGGLAASLTVLGLLQREETRADDGATVPLDDLV
jgi:hypothetical protein